MSDQPNDTEKLTPSALREVALAYLARNAASRARVLRILDRRIDRAVQRAEIAAEEEPAFRRAAREVAANLVSEGIVNDAEFAETRAMRLLRAGRSHRAVAAHLAARGVDHYAVQASLPPGSELAAALATAQRRRIGPFRTEPTDADGARQELAVLARAGFSRDVAMTALRMEVGQAERLVMQLKRE